MQVFFVHVLRLSASGRDADGAPLFHKRLFFFFVLLLVSSVVQ